MKIGDILKSKTLRKTDNLGKMNNMKLVRFLFLVVFCLLSFSSANSQSVWEVTLDSKIQFYQATDFGVLLVGTENSLYALDSKTGEKLWRRSIPNLGETAIVPIPNTDLILISLDRGEKSRLEAVDLLSGERLWLSDKIKGDVMQLVSDTSLVAVVSVKKAFGKVGQQIERKPIIHVFRLSDGKELWKKELSSSVQMMPSRFDFGSQVPFTLDNYRPPLMLDGRLYLFYEGITSYDIQSGDERKRDKFKVNESGLCLTEADPVFDEKYLYVSGRGKVRAIDRKNFRVEWEAKDLGVTSEMLVIGNILYIRTGGRFTRIKDGKAEEKGPFGVSAIDTRNGKILWRYEGTDKGMTNFVFADANTILIADKDDLIALDALSGKKLFRFEHKVEQAQFVLINDKNQAIVGGSDEIAAFDIAKANSSARSALSEAKNKNTVGIEVWRVKHKPPSRGIFRTIVGIALRAVALYFRYGSLVTSSLNFASNSAISSVLGGRWSGIRWRFSSFDLTTLASTKNFLPSQITVFGIAARTPDLFSSRMRIVSPSAIRVGIAPKATSNDDLKETFLGKLDPVKRLERLSDYFLNRQKLSEIREKYMYFYTDLPKPFNRRGLIGVNVNTGKDERFITVSEPDQRFIVDENLLYSADENRLYAFSFLSR